MYHFDNDLQAILYSVIVCSSHHGDKYPLENCNPVHNITQLDQLLPSEQQIRAIMTDYNPCHDWPSGVKNKTSR